TRDENETNQDGPEIGCAMKNQLRAFKKKFGREPSRLVLIWLFQQPALHCACCTANPQGMVPC
ncbi:MAG: hypothetical protein DMG20_07450, partial [Acidobacteria bacterium]